jgi:hypothetical protein
MLGSREGGGGGPRTGAEEPGPYFSEPDPEFPDDDIPF